MASDDVFERTDADAPAAPAVLPDEPAGPAGVSSVLPDAPARREPAPAVTSVAEAFAAADAAAAPVAPPQWRAVSANDLEAQAPFDAPPAAEPTEPAAAPPLRRRNRRTLRATADSPPTGTGLTAPAGAPLAPGAAGAPAPVPAVPETVPPATDTPARLDEPSAAATVVDAAPRPALPTESALLAPPATEELLPEEPASHESASDEPSPADEPSPEAELLALVDEAPPLAALSWVDPATLGTRPSADASTTDPAPDLLPARRRRRGAVAAPLVTAAVLAAGYVGACAVWPLTEVAPVVSAATVEPVPGHELALTWPDVGNAAVGAEGIGAVTSMSSEATPMASIAKLVTSLMILEKAPLAVGEEGPSYDFSYADSVSYWAYRRANESALDVPVGGTLTQRQLLQGILIGSANNYVDRLTTELWGSRDAFVLEVPGWLEAHGLEGITMVDASGIGTGNTATPEAIVKLASLSLANPVIAEIVATQEIELPGAGHVENTNPLLEQPGVVGIKTGALWNSWMAAWNLVTAKNVTIGQTTVTTYVAVLGQPDAESRDRVSETLLREVEASLQSGPSVPAGTRVASVATEWGASADVVTSADATVVLWDRGTAAIDAQYDIEVGLAEGAEVGKLTATGPFNSADVPLTLDSELAGPDLLWRLSHPLKLLGLD
ncbi:D-alanyl-D-alanine carboxypeptidase [Microbacterium album]|uniref:Peptidase S11 D-alanyl-D-alanine carboxypeptidase A N-terminal domain-containing protein n=1 Tax=Microbacterium album TaxID=2053191 RepID=A0A917IHY3_9MICO|nr:D-alanyl-D-alanine carboxypeptidase [Microbacterium album]GGH48669.1 hypothetical protein GCM10010921_26320 [Microbacterium album]